MNRPGNHVPLAHLLFIITIAIKGLDGALEGLAGIIIGITGPERVYHWVIRLTAPELYNGTHVHAVRVIRHGAQHLAATPGTYIVTYLLAHGVVKFAVAAALLRNSGHWIFPLACAVLGGFIGYMSFKLSENWSIWLLGFAIFDAFTLAMVANEWRSLSRSGTQG